jgi:hypothetical protein
MLAAGDYEYIDIAMESADAVGKSISGRRRKKRKVTSHEYQISEFHTYIETHLILICLSEHPTWLRINLFRIL